jgi:hypothetical protein
MLSIFLLAGCGIVGDSALEREAKEAVARQMKDPGSVQFRDIASYSDQKLVCGEVNAKNSFGAYTGFVRFYVDNGRTHLSDDPNGPYPTYDEMCLAAARGEIAPSEAYAKRIIDRLPDGPEKDDLMKRAGRSGE